MGILRILFGRKAEKIYSSNDYYKDDRVVEKDNNSPSKGKREYEVKPDIKNKDITHTSTNSYARGKGK